MGVSSQVNLLSYFGTTACSVSILYAASIFHEMNYIDAVIDRSSRGKWEFLYNCTLLCPLLSTRALPIELRKRSCNPRGAHPLDSYIRGLLVVIEFLLSIDLDEGNP
ncbi:hypothetical protein VNO77_17469 [Canavalia gladiata]|uniref:Uncharacterized protein n=1 Tax=Canavalia gladiata TaxID=3824 RepID=A0AAN9LJ84_CANGL